MSTPTAPLVAAARTLVDGAARAHWRGPDPYDALWSDWPPALAGGTRRRQAIIQLHARSPVDIRRLYRTRHPRIAKSLALFGAASLRLWRVTGDERFRCLALEALDSLDADRSAGDEAWGYPFDVQTRWSFYAAGTPNVVVTSFAVQAFADAREILQDERYDERARAGAAWIRDALYRPDDGWFVYHPGSDTLVHNANLLAAAVVERVFEEDQRVESAVAATLAAQDDDGAWPYGEGGRLGFIDNFHTGFVLTSLCRLRRVPGVDEAVERGARYYADHFFDGAGRALLWPGKPYPEDAHSAGTGMTTLATLRRAGVGDPERLARVAERAAGTVHRHGYAVHRRRGPLHTTVRYLRWCDAHVALGLADAAEVLAGGDPR